jgi:branched-subunit amino acid ABC-type transport system permease component
MYSRFTALSVLVVALTIALGITVYYTITTYIRLMRDSTRLAGTYTASASIVILNDTANLILSVIVLLILVMVVEGVVGAVRRV